MSTYFISDLHLSSQQSQIEQAFKEFLITKAVNADGLYILGDLFEYWIGDDSAHAYGYQEILNNIKTLTEANVPVYFMHGNRDFLVGSEFENLTGCKIIPDPSKIELLGRKILLTHGDRLCTDDVDHQTYRNIVMTKAWQDEFLSKTLQEREQLARLAQQRSAIHKTSISNEIMDVNDTAVKETLISFDIDMLIHGHTHRSDIHNYELNNRQVQRIVMGDWRPTGNILKLDTNGYTLDKPEVI